MNPSALHGFLADIGWKTQTIPIVAEFIAAEARHHPVSPADLQEVRRLAVDFWRDPSMRPGPESVDWRAAMALSILRHEWWRVQACRKEALAV